MTFLDYGTPPLAHFGVTAKDGTQLYQDFDMQAILQPSHIRIRRDKLGRGQAPTLRSPYTPPLP